jgi:hypothetical protein
MTANPLGFAGPTHQTARTRHENPNAEAQNQTRDDSHE